MRALPAQLRVSIACRNSLAVSVSERQAPPCPSLLSRSDRCDFVLRQAINRAPDRSIDWDIHLPTRLTRRQSHEHLAFGLQPIVF
jgi:hypothetical protein